MTKMIRKVRPTDYWRIGEHESWFLDMSLKGLHLYKMGTHLAHFKKGEPKRIEYRIDVTEKKLISCEQIDLYEENGWEYVTSYQTFHVFSSPTENNAPEIHTDPAEQAFTLQQLSKKLMLNFAGITLAVMISLGMLLAVWFLDGTPILRLVEGNAIQPSILILMYMYYVFYASRAMLAIKALKRNLKEGKMIDHHAPWQKKLQKNTAFTVVWISIILISSFMSLYQIIQMDTFTLPRNDDNLPFVRLAEIEENPMLIRDEYYIDEVDWANRYSTNWSILAPVQYETDENGLIENMGWSDESGTYSPSISSEVYKLSFQLLAEPLLNDLIRWNSYEKEWEAYVVRSHPVFDHLLIHEEKEKKQLVASKDNIVLYIRYYGHADLDVIVENAAQKILLLTDK